MTAGGFPHSDTLGSKPCRRLPEAYRGPTRPSSVLSAKASTMRPYRQHNHTGHATATTTANCQTTNHHTNRSQNDRPGPHQGPDETIPSRRHTNRRPSARVHYPVLKPPPHHQDPPRDDTRTGTRWATGTPPTRVAVREPNSASMPPAQSTVPRQHAHTIRPTGRTHGHDPQPRNRRGNFNEISVERR